MFTIQSPPVSCKTCVFASAVPGAERAMCLKLASEAVGLDAFLSTSEDVATRNPDFTGVGCVYVAPGFGCVFYSPLPPTPFF